MLRLIKERLVDINYQCGNCVTCNLLDCGDQCLLRDYDCYDGCEYCISHDECKYDEVN